MPCVLCVTGTAGRNSAGDPLEARYHAAPVSTSYFIRTFPSALGFILISVIRVDGCDYPWGAHHGRKRSCFFYLIRCCSFLRLDCRLLEGDSRLGPLFPGCVSESVTVPGRAAVLSKVRGMERGAES